MNRVSRVSVERKGEILVFEQNQFLPATKIDTIILGSFDKAWQYAEKNPERFELIGDATFDTNRHYKPRKRDQALYADFKEGDFTGAVSLVVQLCSYWRDPVEQGMRKTLSRHSTGSYMTDLNFIFCRRDEKFKLRCFECVEFSRTTKSDYGYLIDEKRFREWLIADFEIILGIPKEVFN